MGQEEMQFAEINGTKLAYSLRGNDSAQTLVMIHAGIADSRMWAAQVAHFSKQYRVLAMDMRGFGQSKMVEGDFAHHLDILALMDALNIQNAILMGCSQGGKVALNIALAQPERVTSLVLVAPAIAGYRYTGASHPLEAALEAADEAGDLELVCELEVQIWLDAGRKPEALEPTMRKLVYEMNLIPLKVDEALWEQEQDLEPLAIERLETIHTPTLLIIGDLDIASSLERAEILEKRLPTLRKVVMRGTAHLPNLEFPDKFNQIVDEFLEAL